MVQDNSTSSEFYLSTLKDGRCGGWGISEMEYVNGIDPSDEIDWSIVKERSTLWAINIPSETEWCTEYLDGEYAAQIGHELQKQDTSASKAHKYPFPNDPHIILPVKVGQSATA